MATTTLSTSAMVAMMIPNTRPRATRIEGPDHAVLDGLDHVLDGVGHLGGPVGLRAGTGVDAEDADGGVADDEPVRTPETGSWPGLPWWGD